MATCRARRRRVLSQFDDLQQCYLRLRQAGRTPAPHLVPVLPSKHARELGEASGSADQAGSKRIKQESSPQPHVRADVDPASLDPLGGVDASGATSMDASSHAQPQVRLPQGCGLSWQCCDAPTPGMPDQVVARVPVGPCVCV